MIVFHYDKTFDGLLTAVFDAYNRKSFPEMLLALQEPEPLFVTESFTVVTDPDKSKRVWTGLKKKLMTVTLNMMSYVWLSESEGADWLLFRYIRKTFDSKELVELNFADDDVLAMRNLARKVNKEREQLVQFVRFQKTADEVFFAAVEPVFNSLSLIIPHFKSRFADQKWVIYDLKRNYGYYYDMKTVTEMTLEVETDERGRLNENILAEDETEYSRLWKNYFQSVTIKERINPKLHRRNLPKRYWKFLTEKQ